MVRVTAPGLPPWPKLFFDRASRRAKISVRHPTWHSHARAIRVTEIASWFVTGYFAYLTWPLTEGADYVGRACVSVMTTAMAYYGLGYLMHRSLRYFLARQVFATQTVFWFTPQAIAFRSRLYDQPVVIWRKWRSLWVTVRFILQQDRSIPTGGYGVRARPNIPMEHLQESALLEMVLTASNRQREASFQGQNTVLRTIPITEISGRFATQFTMVCAAAVALTAPKQNHIQSDSGKGADIDVA